LRSTGAGPIRSCSDAQRGQQWPLPVQALLGDGGNLRMLDRVDFLTPRPGRFVAAVQVEFFVQQQRGEQVGLRVPDQVLHDALGLGVGGLTKIRTEPVVQREPNVITCRDHTVGDDPTLQAAHPVGQHDLGCPAQLGEALTQHSQRGGGLLIGGEPYEPPPP